MPMRHLDPELRLALARDAFAGLDRMLADLPPDDMLKVRHVSAQLRLIKLAAPVTIPAPLGEAA